MKKEEGKRKATYAAWHKAALIGCALVALIGTVGVIGSMIKLSSAISEYGGNIGAPFFVAFLLMALLQPGEIPIGITQSRFCHVSVFEMRAYRPEGSLRVPGRTALAFLHRAGRPFW